MAKLFALLGVCTWTTGMFFLFQVGQQLYALGDPLWQKLGLFVQAMAVFFLLFLAFHMANYIDNTRRY